MFKKQFSKFMAAVIIGSMLLTGCGSSGDSSNATPTPAGNEAVVTPGSDDGGSADTGDEGSTDSSSKPAPEVDASTPFGTHGALAVKGTDLVDANGDQYKLYGMSTHGIAWFPQFVCDETIGYLGDEWNTNCIRLAMYTFESGGYCSDGDQEYLKDLVRTGIDAATANGMYVIVDWHVLNDKNPVTHIADAAAFFDEIVSEYANYDNIIYEICNEPNGSAKWSDIQTYANEIIPIIREYDSNAVVICGTPTWSQDIDKASADPLEFDNVLYALHFYAATHTDWLRDRLTSCHEAGLPVFVSEFGICDASGNGALDYDQASEWMKILKEYNISYMCWNMANKDESSSILKADCKKLSAWEEDDLNDQGIWAREQFATETK